MQLLTQADTSAYFQILLILFINPSYQYQFIEEGRQKKESNPFQDL